MLEQLKYKNHLNEVFEFGKDGIFVDTSDLHDYEWKVTSKNNRISAFDYSVSKRTLPVIIICKTEEDGIAARNRLLEVTEKDIIAMQHGRVIIGDYYFRCFVTKSQKKDYLTNKRYMRITLTLTSDFPYWVKETTSTFRSPFSSESSRVEVLAETTLVFEDGANGTYIQGEIGFKEGETYICTYNGVEYKREAWAISAGEMTIVGIGNQMGVLGDGAENNGDIFTVIDIVGGEMASVVDLSATSPSSVTISIYQNGSSAYPMVVALDETTWTTPKGEFPGMFKPNVPLTLTSGITYIVKWNGNEYSCVPFEGTRNDVKVVALGNPAALGGASADVPFCIMVENGFVAEATDSNLSSTVTVSIKHVIGGQNLDMQHDIPYDFTAGMTTNTLVNSGFTATNFRMVIYGACTNPAVYVGDHLYQVNCEVGASEYLTIDSITKKIFVTASDGSVTNVFNLRNRDSYIFEMIPPGQNAVSWEGNYGVDITLIEERSEPKWT